MEEEDLNVLRDYSYYEGFKAGWQSAHDYKRKWKKGVGYYVEYGRRYKNNIDALRPSTKKIKRALKNASQL